MIETLARKRTQLGALAVLAALAVALFAVFQPAQAANAVVITINDSDNVVKAGAGYSVQVEVKDGADDNTTDWTLEYISVDAGVHLANVNAAALTAVAADRTTEAEATLVVPANADGKYTITAGVLDVDGGPGNTPARLVGSLEVTVGDVGTPIGSVEIALGKVVPAGEAGAGNHSALPTAVTDSGTKPMGSNIAVTVTVLNSLGNKPNNAEVNQVLLFAPAANSGPANEDGSVPGTTTPNSSSASDTPANVGAVENFFVNKGTSGTVDVYALAIGTGGTATSQAITLTYTGNADTIALSEVSSPLPSSSTPADSGATPPVEASGFATLKITAVDAAGNKADLDASTADPPVVTGLSITFKDADDKTVDTITATLSQALKAGQTTCDDTATPTTCDATTVLVTLTTVNAAVGTYTMSATFGEKEAVTTEVVVSGKPANIELASSHDTVELGNIVTITASVTDKDGHAVTNENAVIFRSVGALKLEALDALQQNTDHGEAKIRFVVTDGSGTATIIATDAAEGGEADGVIAVSMATADAAEEPEEVSLDCLSSLTGFSSYTCSMGSSASELFGLVSSRGATAIHLWNGSMWVRYAVVDGNEIPGSSDFSVTEDDILYISN